MFFLSTLCVVFLFSVGCKLIFVCWLLYEFESNFVLIDIGSGFVWLVFSLSILLLNCLDCVSSLLTRGVFLWLIQWSLLLNKKTEKSVKTLKIVHRKAATGIKKHDKFYQELIGGWVKKPYVWLYHYQHFSLFIFLTTIGCIHASNPIII